VFVFPGKLLQEKITDIIVQEYPWSFKHDDTHYEIRTIICQFPGAVGSGLS
jgi:hypothetical protein